MEAMSRRRRRWSIEQSKRVALDRLDSIDITCIPTGEDHTRHGYGQGRSITRPASLGYALCNVSCSAAWFLISSIHTPRLP